MSQRNQYNLAKQAVIKKLKHARDLNIIKSNFTDFSKKYREQDLEIMVAAVEGSLNCDVGYAALMCEKIRSDHKSKKSNRQQWENITQRSHTLLIGKHSQLGNPKGVVNTWKILTASIPERHLSSLTFSFYISALVMTNQVAAALQLYHHGKKKSWKITDSSTNILLPQFTLAEAYDHVNSMLSSNSRRKDKAAFTGLLRCAAAKSFEETEKAMVFVKENLKEELTGTHWNILLESAQRFSPESVSAVQDLRLEHGVPLTTSTFILLLKHAPNLSDAKTIFNKAFKQSSRSTHLFEAYLEYLSLSTDSSRGELAHQLMSSCPFEPTSQMTCLYRLCVYDTLKPIDLDECCVV